MTEPSELELSPDQLTAYNAAEEFINKSKTEKNPYFVVHGEAGTGKTHIASKIAREYPNSEICTLTAKAASVLRQRTDLHVSTVHKAIYYYRGLEKDESRQGRMSPVFVEKGVSFKGRLVILDESSVIGLKLARDLIATGAKILAFGDPGQLPPVNDTQFFRKPNQMLREIHRQALTSPIIRQAHSVRRTGKYEADGEDFRVVKGIKDEDLLETDIVLCWKNSTRIRLNRKKRRALGIEGPTIRAGEPLICLKNDYRLHIFNGAIYEVVEDWHHGDPLTVREEGRESSIRVPSPTVEVFDPDYEDNHYDCDHCPFALAYAITIHKSQGSEYPRTLLIDEMHHSQDAKKLLYTGITRAVKSITVVRTR